MEVNASSIVLGIALFALLSIGIANASLAITSNSITTPIDYPQNAIYTINGISGGVLPYTFNAYYTNGNVPANNAFLGSNTFSPSATYNAIIITITPNSISPNSILITAYNGIVGAANFLFSNTISTGTNTIYGTWTFNAFFADPTGANTISSSNTLTIDPAPTATSLTPSNTILDSGQYVTYNVLISGGALPITANLILVSNTLPIQINGVNAIPGTTYNTIVASSDGTIAFNSLLIATSNSIGGSVTFNVIAVDSANTPVTFNAVANTITIDPSLSVSISPISSTLDANQAQSLITTVSGGTPGFSISYLSSNSLCGSLSATSNSLSADGSNTIIFTANSALTSECSTTFTASVTDSASTHVTKAATSSLTVYPTPSIALTATPSNSIMYGKPFTVNAVITGGTGNFAVYWYLNGNSITPTVVSANTETSNTMTLPAAGNYIYTVTANDIGTSSVDVVTPAANTVVVYKNDTLTATSTSHPATVYVSQPVSITFTGKPTINNQSAWSLYVNGVLYGKPAASQITWSEHAYPPGTYSFVFSNPGNANYDSNSITTTLNIIYQPSGGVTPPPPTTTVTTTIPTTRPQTTLTIAENVSASAPVVINYSIAKALISIKTPSTVPVPVKAFVSNITSTAPLAPTGFTAVSALNISINTTANVSISVTQGYPCNENASLIAPYLFKNGTWVAITPFAVNATACTVTYPIQKDPIVGILEKIPATTTVSTTTVPTTTVPKTTIIPPTTVPPVITPAPNYGLEIAVVVIVVIIIVVILYYYMSKGSKHRR